MNPDHEVNIAGRLAALELLVSQALSLGLASIRSRADLVEELKQQHHAKLERLPADVDRKSTRLNSSHLVISYAVFCLKKNKKHSHCIPQLTVTHCHSFWLQILTKSQHETKGPTISLLRLTTS